MIGGGKQSSLLDQGSTLLKSLLGSKDQSALAGAVSKFAGLGQNTGNQKATSILSRCGELTSLYGTSAPFPKAVASASSYRVAFPGVHY